MNINLKAYAMLGIAFCFYLIGEPIFGFINQILGLPVSWEIIVVGLFLGLLPRREKFIIYGTLIGYTLINLVLGYWKLYAVVETVLRGGVAVTGFLPNFSPIQSDYVPSPLLLFYFEHIIPVILMVLAVYYRIELFNFVKRNLVFWLAGAALSSIPVMFFACVTYYSYGIGFLNYQSSVEAQALLINVMVFYFMFLELWICLVGPWVVCFLFKHMGVYRRIPRIYGYS